MVTFPEMSAFKIPKVSHVGLCVGSFTVKTYFTLKSMRVVPGHKADLSEKGGLGLLKVQLGLDTARILTISFK